MIADATGDAQEYLIDVRGASKKYCRDFRRSLRYAFADMLGAFLPRRDASALRPEEFWAVRDASFTLRRGDSLGVIGHNGAGKSTLLRLVTGQRRLTEGTIVTRGRVLALAELSLGFDPVLTGRENAYVNASILGMSRRALEPVIEDIIAFSELHQFIDSAVQTYSAGMKARLGFSVAAHLEPDILVVDEVLAVGDLNFRRKCVRHIQQYLQRGGSMVLVAHDPHLVQSVCSRCLVMDHGRIVFEGSAVEGVDMHFRIGVAAAAATRAPSRAREPRPPATDGIAQLSADVPGDAATASSSASALEPAPDLSLEPTPDQPVVLDRFEVVAEDGREIRTGGGATVILTCRAQATIDVGWGFTLCTADLQTAIATCVVGLDGRGIRLQPGTNTLRCRIPSLPLRPEVYAIRGAVIDPSTRSPIGLLGFDNLPNYFVVTSVEAEPLANVQAAVGDLIALPVEWVDAPQFDG